MKNFITNKDRLIFALDVANIDLAKQLVMHLGDTVTFYKLGLELCMTQYYFELISWLEKKNKKIFVDVKLFDIPQTVYSAVKNLQNQPVEFITVHGDPAIMKAAVSAKGDRKILAVTVLTSLEQTDIAQMGYSLSITELVKQRAIAAKEIGCDGVVCSGQEALTVRKAAGDDLLIVTPGIRTNNDNKDDQRRQISVVEAFENSADYIVVGRPIRNYYGFENPKLAARAIQDKIAKYFDNL